MVKVSELLVPNVQEKVQSLVLDSESAAQKLNTRGMGTWWSKLQLHFLPNHEEAEVHRWRLATRLHLPFKKARGCLETCTAFEGEEERFFFIYSHRSHGFISVVFATAVTLRKSSLWVICDLPIFRVRAVANPESIIFGRMSSICREGFRRPLHFRLLRSLLFFQP